MLNPFEMMARMAGQSDDGGVDPNESAPKSREEMQAARGKVYACRQIAQKLLEATPHFNVRICAFGHEENMDALALDKHESGLLVVTRFRIKPPENTEEAATIMKFKHFVPAETIVGVYEELSLNDEARAATLPIIEQAVSAWAQA